MLKGMATPKKKKAPLVPEVKKAGRPPVINPCRWACGFSGKATELPKHETNCSKRVR